jgi:hypothetical protein
MLFKGEPDGIEVSCRTLVDVKISHSCEMEGILAAGGL